MPGVDLEAEVLPSFPDTPSEGGDRLIIKSGHQSSLPLPLPGRALPGKKDIKVQSGHYEIKLASLPVSAPPPQPTPLLDATQLSATNPTSFICASCSLPLIHSSRISRYRDLPSEHWQELVDAWMCHSDQKLHEHVAKNGKGFWPEIGQALVGGSYILFDESAVSRTNLHSTAASKVRAISILHRTIKKTGVGCPTNDRIDVLLTIVTCPLFGATSTSVFLDGRRFFS